MPCLFHFVTDSKASSTLRGFVPFLFLYRTPRNKSLKIGDFVSHAIDAINAKVFIFKLPSISQAGRRGFDPRLPLHVFIDLQAIWETPPIPRYSVYSIKPTYQF